jgi:hypothetical protein
MPSEVTATVVDDEPEHTVSFDSTILVHHSVFYKSVYITNNTFRYRAL